MDNVKTETSVATQSINGPTVDDIKQAAHVSNFWKASAEDICIREFLESKNIRILDVLKTNFVKEDRGIWSWGCRRRLMDGRPFRVGLIWDQGCRLAMDGKYLEICASPVTFVSIPGTIYFAGRVSNYNSYIPIAACQMIQKLNGFDFRRIDAELFVVDPNPMHFKNREIPKHDPFIGIRQGDTFYKIAMWASYED
jgi:hypothetical protein